jgi:hypothetical protein
VSERVQCEFFLIRYVPDAVKNEFVNIGVLLREQGQTETAQVRFTRDWSRVRCMDPDADIEMLEALEGEIQQRLALGARDVKPVMQVLEDTLSNSLQITEAKGCLAESVATELEQLATIYVETLKTKSSRRRTGRAAILATMRTEFEKARVWAMMRKRIDASMYTRAGDPMRIDCGYRPNGVIRMFQAVSLENDVEMAKGLAYSAPRLSEGVLRVEEAKLELTAIVEPLRAMETDENAERYRFGVETMEQANIRVLTVGDLGRVAETARIELKL